MEKKQLKEYGAAFAIAKRLFKSELITDEEYRKLTEALIRKYRHVIGSAESIMDNSVSETTTERR